MAMVIKRKITRVGFYGAILFFLSQSAFADLPLDIEGLLTEKGKLKLDLGLSYVNINRTGVAVGEAQSVQIGPTQVINLPSQIGEARLNSDTLIPSLGWRYGLSANTEVYGKTTWIADYARIQTANANDSRSHNQFNDAWLGINHRFIEEDSSPALLGFVEVALAEKQIDSTVYGKSWLAGATIYRSIDPVVLSMTSAYQYRARRQDGASLFDPGHLFLLSPQVSFAANDKVTLSSGLTWRHHGANRRVSAASVMESQRNTITTLNLGLAYLWDQRTQLSLSSRSEVSGKGSTEISLTVQMKLGGLPVKAVSTPSRETIKE